jgi:hypothetical protein
MSGSVRANSNQNEDVLVVAWGHIQFMGLTHDFKVKHIWDSVQRPRSTDSCRCYFFLNNCSFGLSYPTYTILGGGNDVTFFEKIILDFFLFFMKKKWNYGFPKNKWMSTKRLILKVVIIISIRWRENSSVVTTVQTPIQRPPSSSLPVSLWSVNKKFRDTVMKKFVIRNEILILCEIWVTQSHFLHEIISCKSNQYFSDRITFNVVTFI